MVNTALWIAAGLLAAVFLTAGVVKLILPKAKLVAAPAQGWAEDFSEASVKSIGILEVLAAAGLIFPPVLGTWVILVPLAAIGLAFIMAGAIATHLRRGEITSIAGNLVYLALAVFVAWGRVAWQPFMG